MFRIEQLLDLKWFYSLDLNLNRWLHDLYISKFEVDIDVLSLFEAWFLFLQPKKSLSSKIGAKFQVRDFIVMTLKLSVKACYITDFWLGVNKIICYNIDIYVIFVWKRVMHIIGLCDESVWCQCAWHRPLLQWVNYVYQSLW